MRAEHVPSVRRIPVHIIALMKCLWDEAIPETPFPGYLTDPFLCLHSVKLGLGQLPHPCGRLLSSALSLEGQMSWLALPETKAGLSPQHCGHGGWVVSVGLS